MSDPLPVGSVIADRYTIRSLLAGTGVDGSYRAEAIWGGGVTLTVFTPPYADTPTGARVRQAFLRYARLLAQVQHPGVPRVTDLIETPEGIVVVQEDRLHHPLREVMGGALPPGQAEAFTRHLFGALAAAHAQALLHTRLTPEQVWFDAQEQPVLAGFGLASRALREVGQETAPDPRYAAPELLAGGTPSPQTDVYALAATLLEAVTGHALPPTTARKQGVPLPPLPAGTRPAVRAALTQALHLEPSERAVSAAEVLEEMDRAGEEVSQPLPTAPPVPEPAAATTVAVPERASSRPSRPGWPVLAVLGALALGGAFAVFQPGRKDAPELSVATVQEEVVPPAPEPVAASVPPASLPPPEPEVLRTEVVTALQLNLRESPTTAGAVLARVSRGERLDVLTEQGAWLQVKTTSGQNGWVSNEHTLPLLSEETTEALLGQLSAGGEVSLERGVYWFDQPVTLTTAVNVIGAGQKATLLMSDAAEDTLILEEAEVNLTGLSVVHVGPHPARAVLQEGGVLTAERVTLSGAVRDRDEEEYGSGLWVKDAGQATLRQVTLRENAYGLYVSDTSQVQVTRSTLSGNAEGGVLFKDDATGEVEDTTVAENGAHGIHILGQAAPHLNDNRIRRNRGRGITIYGQAHPTITGNTIEENTLQGVGVQGTARPTLNGNTIQGNKQSGLTYFDNAGGSAEGNTLQANLKTGVALTEYASPTLTGNTITRNRQNGLSYADSSGGTAHANVISGNGNPGISAWGDAQPTLTENKIQDNKQSGVVLAERSSGEFSGNIVSGNALYGLIVTGSASPTVTENTVAENGRGGIFYKQNAGGQGYGNTCYGNGGSDLSAELDPDQSGPDFSMDGCTPS